MEEEEEGRREGNVPWWAPQCEDCVISPSINSKWIVPSVATFHLFLFLLLLLLLVPLPLAFMQPLEVLFVKEKRKRT